MLLSRKLNLQYIFLIFTTVPITFFNTSVTAQTTENSDTAASAAPKLESAAPATSGITGQSQSTEAPTSKAFSPSSSVTQPRLTTQFPLSTNAFGNQTSTSEQPMLGDQPSISATEPIFDIPSYSLQLINNSDFLYLEFTPGPNMLEIVIKMNMTLYKDFKANTKSAETVGKFSPIKIDIGFDYGPLIDVVSIPLVPFTEELEKTGGSVRGNTKDSVQDLSWSKRSGVLIPDVDQSYQLLSLDVAKNGTFIATRITRPWLTCDESDVQFTLEPISIYWNLESVEGNQPMLTSEKPKSANQQAPPTTHASLTSLPPDSSPSAVSPPSPTDSSSDKTLKNLSTEISILTPTPSPSISHNTTQTFTFSTTAEPEVEVLRSIQDLNFRGPIYVNLSNLFGNSVSILLQGCSVDGNQGKRKLDPLYNCTIKEYEGRRQIKSLLRVYGLMMLPQAQASPPRHHKSTSGGGKSFFAEHEFQPCPSSKEFQDISNSLFRALTGGGGGGKRRGKMNGRESESKNHSMSSYHHLLSQQTLLTLLAQLAFTLLSHP